MIRQLRSCRSGSTSFLIMFPGVGIIPDSGSEPPGQDMESHSSVAACYNVGRNEAQAACNLLQKVDREIRNRLEELVRRQS